MNGFSPSASVLLKSRNFNARHVLFDTNILIDAADPNRPQHAEARKALQICGDGEELGLVTSGSLKDAYYLLSRSVGRISARKIVYRLLDLLVVLPVDAEACLIAAESNEPDFEDALIRVAGELNHVDFILTRDRAAFQNSRIRSIDCAEYLRIVESDRLRPRDMSW